MAQKGETVGDHELEVCLGEGANGEAWLSTKGSVVKMQDFSLEEVGSSLVEECVFAQLAKERSPSSFTSCSAVGEHAEGVWFAVFEKAQGTEVEKWILGEEEAASLSDVSGAFAMGQKIYDIEKALASPSDGIRLAHCDMNPGNLFISGTGGLVAVDYGKVIICCKQEPCSLSGLPAGAEDYSLKSCASLPQGELGGKEFLQDINWLFDVFMALADIKLPEPLQLDLGSDGSVERDMFLESSFAEQVVGHNGKRGHDGAALASMALKLLGDVYRLDNGDEKKEVKIEDEWMEKFKLKMRSPFKDQLEDGNHETSKAAIRLLLKALYPLHKAMVETHDITNRLSEQEKKDVYEAFKAAAAR